MAEELCVDLLDRLSILFSAKYLDQQSEVLSYHQRILQVVKIKIQKMLINMAWKVETLANTRMLWDTIALCWFFSHHFYLQNNKVKVLLSTLNHQAY